MEFVPESTELSGIFLKELALKKVDITVGASSPRDGWMGGWMDRSMIRENRQLVTNAPVEFEK